MQDSEAAIRIRELSALIVELEASHHKTSMALKSELIEAHKAIGRLNMELMAKDEVLRRLKSCSE